jgi:hypothetical protein
MYAIIYIVKRNGDKNIMKARKYLEISLQHREEVENGIFYQMGLKMLQNSQTTPQIFKIPVILPLFDSVLFFAGAAGGAVGNHAICNSRI